MFLQCSYTTRCTGTRCTRQRWLSLTLVVGILLAPSPSSHFLSGPTRGLFSPPPAPKAPYPLLPLHSSFPVPSLPFHPLTSLPFPPRLLHSPLFLRTPHARPAPVLSEHSTAPTLPPAVTSEGETIAPAGARRCGAWRQPLG